MSDKNYPLDFAHIKRAVRIEWVLEKEGLLEGLRRSGNGLIGRCPIHQGNNPGQFRVDFHKQLFRCFSPKCGATGDVINLISAVHHIRIEEAAALLVHDFAVAARQPATPRRKPMAADDKGGGRAPDYRVFTVRGDGDDAWWTRIGSAWKTKGDGINIQLDALPLDGKLVLRLPKEDEDEPPKKKAR